MSINNRMDGITFIHWNNVKSTESCHTEENKAHECQRNIQRKKPYAKTIMPLIT